MTKEQKREEIIKKLKSLQKSIDRDGLTAFYYNNGLIFISDFITEILDLFEQENKNYNWYGDVINAFRQFKLGNSLFQDIHRVTHREIEEEKLSNIDHSNIREYELRQRLSGFILQHQPSATIKTEVEYGDIEYRTELLILKMEDFKIIVEAAIQLIPDQRIKEIKEGQLIITQSHDKERTDH